MADVYSVCSLKMQLKSTRRSDSSEAKVVLQNCHAAGE